MRDEVLRAQQANNDESAGLWEDFAGHRHTTTELALRVHHGSTGGRIVVLGAGNCNDLDLRRLLGSFSEIHLVDLDETALRAGVQRQGVQLSAQVRLHGSVDVTAFPVEVADQLRGAEVVLSSCLLTQLIDTAEQDGLDGRGLLAVRDAHLRLVAELAGGGVGVIVTDVVSSETLPELGTVGTQRLPSLLVSSLNAGNFFTGTNPFAIERVLAADPSVSPSKVRVTPPWLWQLKRRTYLVCGIVFQTREMSQNS